MGTAVGSDSSTFAVSAKTGRESAKDEASPMLETRNVRRDDFISDSKGRKRFIPLPYYSRLLLLIHLRPKTNICQLVFGRKARSTGQRSAAGWRHWQLV